MHVQIGPTAPVIVQASFDAATSGDIVAAQTGKALRIYGVNFQTAGNMTVKFTNGSTDLEPARSCITGTPVNIVHPIPGRPAYQTTAGQAFKCVLSGATQVSGSVWYSAGDA